MPLQDQDRSDAHLIECLHDSSSDTVRKNSVDRRDDAGLRLSISPTPLRTINSAVVEGKTPRDPAARHDGRDSDNNACRPPPAAPPTAAATAAWRLHSGYECPEGLRVEIPPTGASSTGVGLPTQDPNPALSIATAPIPACARPVSHGTLSGVGRTNSFSGAVGLRPLVGKGLPPVPKRDQANAPRTTFSLPPDEVYLDNFSCALQKKILLQGRLYLFENYVCFHSNVFGYVKVKVIPLADVTGVFRRKTALVVPNAVELTVFGKREFFTSFLFPDKAFRKIMHAWRYASKYAKLFMGADGAISPISSRSVDGAMQLGGHVEGDEWGGSDGEEEHGEATEMEAHSGEVEEEEELQELENEEDVEAEAPSQLLLETRAPDMQPLVRTRLELSVADFFATFWADDTTFFTNFLESRGQDCTDVKILPWRVHPHFGHARDVTFKSPVRVAFGPKRTTCHQTQVYRFRNGGSLLIVETSQVMTDIPYGDYFKVEMRWEVTSAADGAACEVDIFLSLPFRKKTVLKARIEASARDETRKQFQMWIDTALAHVTQLKAANVLGRSLTGPGALNSLPSPGASTPATAADPAIVEWRSTVQDMLEAKQKSEDHPLRRSTRAWFQDSKHDATARLPSSSSPQQGSFADQESQATRNGLLGHMLRYISQPLPLMLILLMSSQMLIVYLLLNANFGHSVVQAESSRDSSGIPHFVSTQYDHEVLFSTTTATSVKKQNNLERATVHTPPLEHELTLECNKNRLKFMASELQVLERRIAMLHEEMMLTRQTLDHTSAECTSGNVNADVPESSSYIDGDESMASADSPRSNVLSTADTL